MGREKYYKYIFIAFLNFLSHHSKLKTAMIKYIIITLFISLLYAENKDINIIVSLTPSITEEIYLLNEKDKLLGITSFCKKISNKQIVVGSYTQPNIEQIIKIKPDVVLINKEGVQKEIVQQIKSFNINVIVFNEINNYNDLKQNFLLLADMFNKSDYAKKIIENYEKKYKKTDNLNKKVLFFLSLEPFVVVSTTSYIGEIIKFAGATNLINTSIKYPQLNYEAILKLNPDVIFIIDMSNKPKNNFVLDNIVKSKIPSFRNKKIFVLDSNLFCQPTVKNFWLSVEKIRSKLLQ